MGQNSTGMGDLPGSPGVVPILPDGNGGRGAENGCGNLRGGSIDLREGGREGGREREREGGREGRGGGGGLRAGRERDGKCSSEHDYFFGYFSFYLIHEKH